jgi:carbonic anhydrase
MQLREVTFPEDSARLKAVIFEYVAWLDMDLSYRGFDQEMPSHNLSSEK